MMLWEEGRFILSDPIGKFIPAFNDTKVAVMDGDSYSLTEQIRKITIQDLLRHTSGLTYEFRGSGAIQKAYAQARIARLKQTNTDQASMSRPCRWRTAGDDVGVQPLHRRAGPVGRGAVGPDPRRFPAGPYPRAIGPGGCRVRCARSEAGPHRRTLAKDPESGADVALLDVRRPALFESAAVAWLAQPWTMPAS